MSESNGSPFFGEVFVIQGSNSHKVGTVLAQSSVYSATPEKYRDLDLAMSMRKNPIIALGFDYGAVKILADEYNYNVNLVIAT